MSNINPVEIKEIRNVAEGIRHLSRRATVPAAFSYMPCGPDMTMIYTILQTSHDEFNFTSKGMVTIFKKRYRCGETRVRKAIKALKETGYLISARKRLDNGTLSKGVIWLTVDEPQYYKAYVDMLDQAGYYAPYEADKSIVQIPLAPEDEILIRHFPTHLGTGEATLSDAAGNESMPQDFVDPETVEELEKAVFEAEIDTEDEASEIADSTFPQTPGQNQSRENSTLDVTCGNVNSENGNHNNGVDNPTSNDTDSMQDFNETPGQNQSRVLPGSGQTQLYNTKSISSNKTNTGSSPKDHSIGSYGYVHQQITESVVDGCLETEKNAKMRSEGDGNSVDLDDCPSPNVCATHNGVSNEFILDPLGAIEGKEPKEPKQDSTSQTNPQLQEFSNLCRLWPNKSHQQDAFTAFCALRRQGYRLEEIEQAARAWQAQNADKVRSKQVPGLAFWLNMNEENYIKAFLPQHARERVSRASFTPSPYESFLTSNEEADSLHCELNVLNAKRAKAKLNGKLIDEETDEKIAKIDAQLKELFESWAQSFESAIAC